MFQHTVAAAVGPTALINGYSYTFSQLGLMPLAQLLQLTIILSHAILIPHLLPVQYHVPP